MKNKIITSILMMLSITLLLLMPNCFATDSSEIIEFKDSAVKDYFVNGTYSHIEYHENGGYSETFGIAMDENGDGEISTAEMAKIETIYLNIDSEITDYSFFEYCENLRVLQIYDQGMEDISFLENLTTLEELGLGNNNISDISILKNLTNLKELYLNDNNVSDTSVVSNLTNLKILSLGRNKLKSIPDLSKITAFNDINIYNKYGEYNIYADFYGNEITDISGLKNTIFSRISLYNNKITDVSALSTMTNLQNVDLSNNEITNFSSLPKTITTLMLFNNKVSDISYLKNFSNLNYLHLSGNEITDVSILNELKHLRYVSLDNNKIEALELKDLEELTSIYFSNNNLKTVSIENVPNLMYIYLDNNNISDITSLEGLSKVTILNLSTNPISDISPIANTSATRIFLIDTLVNPYNEATFHIMCTWEEYGKNLFLGDYSQFKPSNEESFTTKEIEEVTVGEEKVTVMPTEKKTTVEEILTASNFPVIDTYTIKVLDANGNEKESNAKVGSRNVIQITDEEGQVLAEYMVVVPGDVNGDGETKIYDSFQILKDVLVSLGDAIDAIEVMIRDYNEDGNIRIYDAFQYLKEAILG